MAQQAAAPLPLVLCTDFGPASPYVGQMKLVIHHIAPAATVVDLAHDLPPQHVVGSTLVLAGAARYLPEQTVLCAVIDPGVGSDRRILAACYRPRIWVVAPDNGLFAAFEALGSPIETRVVENRELFLPEVAAVFHGRDVFAPVAARLASGLDPSELGPTVGPEDITPLPRPYRKPPRDGIEVVYVDPFGNLVTSLQARELPEGFRGFRAKGHPCPLVSHYAEAPRGSLVALQGSFGHLELAVCGGSAATMLEAKEGLQLQLL